MKSFLPLGAILVLAAPPAHALDLHLVCRGQTDKSVPRTAFASVSGTSGYASGTVIASGRETFLDEVSVEVVDGGARVMVPPKMLPPIHGGGHDGWWPVDQLQISDREIVGRYSVNVFNKAKLRIDRQTGSIAIDGLTESFRGTCEVADPAARKF